MPSFKPVRYNSYCLRLLSLKALTIGKKVPTRRYFLWELILYINNLLRVGGIGYVSR